jgi:heterodisulfide reductase subunit A
MISNKETNHPKMNEGEITPPKANITTEESTKSQDLVGAVMVVGGGIAGMQSSLDLASSGFKVYLVETTESIGGWMARLDKTFPTNDCAMCTIAPTLVGTGRHHNITILTGSKVESVKGKKGNFRVQVKTRPRYINLEKCTGCGLCSAYCPMNAPSEFDEGVGLRAATFVRFPQAVPLVYAIDREKCIGCGLCQEYCKAGAVEYDQSESISEFNVGSIILAPGYDRFDPTVKEEYGYGVFKNVITSTEFERILSASGPYAGHVMRPSDGSYPQKIAWIQCVGSRDEKVNRLYCSAVCCTYATKEAIIAKEHLGDIEATIFYMDMRTYGKGFEEYYNRAKNEYKINYVRCRIPHIEEDPETKDLKVVYRDDEENLHEEIFNLVVLSVGLTPPENVKDIADTFGIKLNEFGFCETKSFTPLESSRPGIFVAGAFSSPKDIPDTVAQASAVAAKSTGFLSSERNKLITVKEFPPEIDLGGQPRVGVFVCHCGINIGSVVNVPEVVEYIKDNPHVVHVEHNLFTCSADTQTKIKEMITEYNLNRVIVASCTPRTHEPLFQKTIQEVGINPYLFDLASIREHCSWVHKNDPEKATEKAKELVEMMVEKVVRNKPVYKQPVKVSPACLIIGGGIAGMTAALELSDQKLEAHIVEKSEYLGGNLRNIHFLLDKEDPKAFLENTIKRVENDPNIHVHLSSKLVDLKGYIGNFEATVKSESSQEKITAGAIIVATGAKELKPKGTYLYGEDDRVVTQLEFDKELSEGDFDKDNNKNIVMIQCVGSREKGREYCSRICCTEAVKNALKLKEVSPDTNVFVLFRDMRTYGFKETFYRKARENFVRFLRFKEEEKPNVFLEDGKLTVEIMDHTVKKKIKIHPDKVVLSCATIPFDENSELAQILKVPTTEYNFFLEAHMKIKPIDFAASGIYLCGTCHSPKFLNETIFQATGAAQRAIMILTKEGIDTEGVPVFIDQERCTGCGICVSNCAYQALAVNEEKGVVEVNEVLCKGCGACTAICPSNVPYLRQFEPAQIMAMIEAMAES